MNSRAAAGDPGAARELRHRRDDRAPADPRHAGPPGIAQDRERVLVAGAAEPLDGAAADDVLVGRPVEQRRQQRHHFRPCASARAPAPLRPRRSSWRRRGAGDPRGRGPPPRRPGSRRGPRPRPVGRAGARRRSPPPARRARRRAGSDRARAPPRPARPRTRRPATPPRGAAMPAGSGSWPSARAAATRSTASRATASCRRHSAGFFSRRIDFRTTSPGIEDHLGRARGQVKLEGVRRFGHADALVALAAVDLEANRRRELERRRLGRDRLLLGEAQRPDLPILVPLPAPLELGVARPRDPAVEQLVDVAPGRLLDGAREIPRLDRPVRVLAGVEADRPPERGVAQLVPQHVEDASALLVEVRVEQVDRLLVLPADDGTLIAPGLVQVTLGVDQQLEVGLVASLGVLAPDVLEVRREALVQPRLGPLAAGQQVAPPLVGQLVRHQALDVVIDRGPLVEQHQIGQRRRGGVLHAAEDELGDGDLTVAGVGVGDADALREEVDHLGRAPEAAARVGLASGRNEVEDVDAGARRAVGDLHERAGRQRHQVGRLRELERVVPAHAIAGQLDPLAQHAVRQHEVARGRRADHLGREFLDRVIDARPVVT